ncbi:hypothetical protein J437_LFUL009067 [Ladona fulva]|uniref:Uncharacterized protein n=1 Tax=Ladona fulva TaxID=123851 RepID=A0A8K0P1Q1_LADFU|nr:hypothetical protein J437_LFUL009067 [Ladona fulva]
MLQRIHSDVGGSSQKIADSRKKSCSCILARRLHLVGFLEEDQLFRSSCKKKMCSCVPEEERCVPARRCYY